MCAVCSKFCLCACVRVCAMKHGSASGCRWLHTYTPKTCLLHLVMTIYIHTYTNNTHEKNAYTNNGKQTQSRTLLLITRTRCCVTCKSTICTSTCIYIIYSMYMRKWCAQMVVRVEREHIVVPIKKKTTTRNLAHLERAKEFFLCTVQRPQHIY